MTILIKGMEMPGRCYDCGFYYCEAGGESSCAGMGDGIVVGYEDVDPELAIAARPDWCPLIEVPTPHGRLIDADAIPFVQSEDGCTDDYAYRYDINELPTVIEAEEG